MHVATGEAGPVSVSLHRTAHAKSTYRRTVLAKRPVGYWRLGERKSPRAADASSYGRHGVYIGTPVFGEVGAIDGDANRAVKLKGPSSRDYIEIADPGAPAVFSQPTSGQGLTVEAWMRP